jgi:hypothetical protein
MTHHSLLTVTCLALAAASGVEAQRLPLVERVKAHGTDFHAEIRLEYPRPGFETIVAESDAIIIGTVGSATPVLTASDPGLDTDYKVTVDQLIWSRSSTGVQQGRVVVVRRPGGATTIDGHNVVVSEADFPSFQASEKYVLFLERVASASYFRPRYGGQSAFRITGGSVRQAFLGFGDWNDTRGPLALAAFTDEVRQIIAAATASPDQQPPR